MDNNDIKATVVFMSTLLLAILMISSCVRNETLSDEKIQITCIKAGGNWSKIGEAGNLSCKMK